MELKDAWQWYCLQRLGCAELPEAVPVSPWETLELLWYFHPLFMPRMDSIRATRYSTAFDEEADGALAYLAVKDETATWDAMSAGAWRVLHERLTFAEVVACADEAARAEVMSYLPAGLGQRERSVALLLSLLLDPARTIDRRVLPEAAPGSAQEFPATTSLRRQ